MKPPKISPYHSPDSLIQDTNKSSRRNFLAASTGAIAAAFLPASILSLLDVAQVEARPSKLALLPPIAQFASNPCAQAAISRLTTLLESEKAQPFAGFSRSTAAFDVGAAGDDVLELIRAYNYDESPLKGDGECLKAIIGRCDCMYSMPAP